jgi:hypothetical protein
MDVFDMARNGGFVALEQLSHLVYCEPYGFFVEAHINGDPLVIRLEDDDVAIVHIACPSSITLTLVSGANSLKISSTLEGNLQVCLDDSVDVVESLHVLVPLYPSPWLTRFVISFASDDQRAGRFASAFCAVLSLRAVCPVPCWALSCGSMAKQIPFWSIPDSLE